MAPGFCRQTLIFDLVCVCIKSLENYKREDLSVLASWGKEPQSHVRVVTLNKDFCSLSPKILNALVNYSSVQSV